VAISVDAVGMTFASANGADPVVALDPVDLTVADREFVCLVGPSGCGKTTLLRILAGVLAPTSGSVTFDRVAPDRRPTALVFQEHGLFPWMDVLDNVAFGLETQGVGRRERRERAATLVDRVGLAGFAAAYPHQLSGGMRQRVGIARALLTDPQVLLMDEPFGALDAQTKLVMQEELLSTWERDPREIVYVTHDINEAVRLGDRVVVLSGRPGRIIADLPVPSPRPRHWGRSDAEQRRIRQEIWGLLEEEVRRHARS
jgi:NitT/TauT family transport system ATP-binding protein